MTNDERHAEAARRWRLVLGQDAAPRVPLNVEDAAIDGALFALYGTPPDNPKGGLGASARKWRAGWATSANTSRPAWSR
jgi:hypothetical protein